jgi:hypothetical protein
MKRDYSETPAKTAPYFCDNFFTQRFGKGYQLLTPFPTERLAIHCMGHN